MNDRNISVCAVIAWGAGLMAVLVAFVVGFGVLHPGWSLLGVLAATLAHGMAMRRWLCRLAERERNAFELGRESVRSVR